MLMDGVDLVSHRWNSGPEHQVSLVTVGFQTDPT